MKFCHQSVFLFVILMTSLTVVAQQEANDVVLKAMQDEMQRGMTGLKLPNLDKPFFMMYGVSDRKTYSIVASLGALMQSSENMSRESTTSRLLVGDYAFNDESLEDDITTNTSARAIDFPLEDDYFGIRRSLWSHSDKIYKEAARHFEKNKETLKESGKALTEIPHRSFAKMDPVRIIGSRQVMDFDKKEWERQARSLSGLFLHHNRITNSSVAVAFSTGSWYLVTSEGTVARIPFQQASVIAIFQTKNSGGEFGSDFVVHIAGSAGQLPSEKELMLEIKERIDKVEEQMDAPSLEDDYSGPVLLMNDAVADFLSVVLLSRGKESLMNSDEIEKLTGYQFNQNANSMDSKMGKTVIHESITVKAKPKLTSYLSVPLLGGFSMDNEGVVPPDELTLIDGGVLKNMMNNRTITEPSQTANGFGGGPGVLEVTFQQTASPNELKEKLIAQAKSKGLDYAVLIRNFVPGNQRAMNVYKVMVSDGKEILVRNAGTKQLGFKNLKRPVFASATYKGFNLPLSSNVRPITTSGIVSLIVPDALLLEDIELQQVSKPTLKEEEYISSPLK